MVRFTLFQAAVALNAAIVSAGPDLNRWGDYITNGYREGIEWENVGKTKQDIYNACFGYGGKRGHYQDVGGLECKDQVVDREISVITDTIHRSTTIRGRCPRTRTIFA